MSVTPLPPLSGDRRVSNNSITPDCEEKKCEAGERWIPGENFTSMFDEVEQRSAMKVVRCAEARTSIRDSKLCKVVHVTVLGSLPASNATFP
jgi:hypothetical protein